MTQVSSNGGGSTTTIRVSADLLEEAKRLATEAGLPASQAVEMCLRAGIRAMKRKGSKEKR